MKNKTQTGTTSKRRWTVWCVLYNKNERKKGEQYRELATEQLKGPKQTLTQNETHSKEKQNALHKDVNSGPAENVL